MVLIPNFAKMNNIKRLFGCFLLILFLSSFGLPKKLEKKVNKEIGKTFSIENFQLTEIEVSQEVLTKLPFASKGFHLLKIESNSKLIGYAYVDSAPSHVSRFDYLILLNKDYIIEKTKVLIYREDYGGEIGSKRWLKQFVGLTSTQSIKYQKDIIPISGATISAQSMTIAVNNFLQNLKVLLERKVL